MALSHGVSGRHVKPAVVSLDKDSRFSLIRFPVYAMTQYMEGLRQRCDQQTWPCWRFAATNAVQGTVLQVLRIVMYCDCRAVKWYNLVPKRGAARTYVNCHGASSFQVWFWELKLLSG